MLYQFLWLVFVQVLCGLGLSTYNKCIIIRAQVRITRRQFFLESIRFHYLILQQLE